MEIITNRDNLDLQVVCVGHRAFVCCSVLILTHHSPNESYAHHAMIIVGKFHGRFVPRKLWIGISAANRLAEVKHKKCVHESGNSVFDKNNT